MFKHTRIITLLTAIQVSGRRIGSQARTLTRCVDSP